MAFLNGGITFLRYRLVGAAPGMFEQTHLDALAERCGLKTGVASADGVQVGWMAGGHIFDDKFDLEKNILNDFMLFDMRTQVENLPPDRLKAYYETDLAALVKESPGGKATNRLRREAKQMARARIEEEAKDGRYRKWTCIPVVWDRVTNQLLFGATSATQAERFVALWNQTFPEHGEPEPITAASLAVSINPAAANEHLSPFVPGTTPEDVPAWCPFQDDPQFLGNEFLMWLWHFTATEGDTLKCPDGSDVTVMFQGGVKLEDPRGQTGNVTANSDAGVRLPEARAAAAAGKLPRKAFLTAVRHNEQYSFMLQAESLALSGVRLPAWQGEGGQRERNESRLQHVREVAELLDQLFGAFLARRLSPFWAGDVVTIANWLETYKVAA